MAFSLFDDDEPADLLDRMDPADPMASHRHKSQAAKARKTAWVLSLAGFIPFGGLALATLFLAPRNPQEMLVMDALKTYGAVILSFLGGTRWGMALRNQNRDDGATNFILSVVPSLVGWFSLLLPAPYVFGVQALAFAGQGAWDVWAGQRGEVQMWFVKLRQVLTFLVTGAMIVAFFGTV
ncbi:MAG: DUF3429 domain-containing protein [Pseudomonadota bacterium]